LDDSDNAFEVDARDWMAWFVGASETELIDQKERFIDNDGNFRQPGGHIWPAGRFECLTIDDLQRDVSQLEAVRLSELRCPLNVIDSTDVGYYQATFTTEQKAMVQIASNFHCLENGSPSTPADCGRLVSGYALDSTQGPAASFGVPAASLVRAHYAFREAGKTPDLWGQTCERQVNLIENICTPPDKYCGDCQNGKARLLGEEQPVTPDLVDHVAGKVKIGLHSDAQVVFCRGSTCLRVARVDPPPFVDQVCTATLCYGFANRLHDPPKQQLECLTRALLRAAYEGTYLAAIKRQRKVLLLTLIGGASFRNPHDVILSELKRAHDKYAEHPASQLEEVQLVLYERGVATKYSELLVSSDIKACGEECTNM